MTSAQAVLSGARTWTSVASRTINLIREGSDYGKHNLEQLDIKLAKRFTIDGPPARRLRPLQRVQQQLALHGDDDVFDGGERHVAASDERVAESLLQARRERQLLDRPTG